MYPAPFMLSAVQLKFAALQFAQLLNVGSDRVTAATTPCQGHNADAHLSRWQVVVL